MAEPSKYEMRAWQEVLDHREDWWRRQGRALNDAVATQAGKVVERVRTVVDQHPRVRSGLDHAGAAAERGGHAVKELVPDGAKDWTLQAAQSAGRTVRKLTQVGMTPDGVVAKHQKLNHPVESLHDIRDLDLQMVDKARGRRFTTSHLYPLLSGGAGAGSSFVITGGEMAILPTAGAAAAPGAGAIMAALAADSLLVLGMLSRGVATVALSYGYDPNSPGEKLFVSAVVNAGAAGTSAAKMAAMRDLSTLTQNLVRNKSWEVLTKSKVAWVLKEAAEKYVSKFTKKALGKAVPVVGIGLGFFLNYDTVDRVVDAAEMAYRRRFLLDKYPHLLDTEPELDLRDIHVSGQEDDEDVISIVDLLAAAEAVSAPQITQGVGHHENRSI